MSLLVDDISHIWERGSHTALRMKGIVEHWRHTKLICIKERGDGNLQHRHGMLPLESRRAHMQARAYDDLIMDHIRHARNYRVPDAANRQGAGSNPLCGDEMIVYLRIEAERIADAAFQCTCCGISMASASIMTEMVKGAPKEEAKALLRRFVDLVGGRAAPADGTSAEWLALLDTLTKFPSRARCAALPWETLEGLLERGAEGSGNGGAHDGARSGGT